VTVRICWSADASHTLSFVVSSDALPRRSVASLGWVRRDVVTVPANMPTIAAFALMLNRGVSGAGVVPENTLEEGGDAPLLSSLSVSDIRVLHRAADFDALALPVADFLLYHYGAVLPSIDVGPNATAVAMAQPAPSMQSTAEGTPAEVASAAAQVAAMEVSVSVSEGGAEAEASKSLFGGITVAEALPTADALAAAMEEAPPAPRLWLVSCTPESTLREVRPHPPASPRLLVSCCSFRIMHRFYHHTPG
jgi:hypothetical protein